MNDYLIPANTKKGQLILGIFRPIDLMLFGFGVAVTFIFMFIVPMTSTLMTVIILLPALITGFLVVPIPNYHNILTILLEMIDFFVNQRRYYWKGWCIRSDSKKQFKK